MKLTGVVPRRVSEVLMEQVRVEPVVALHGPRSVGKSTVLRAFAAQAGSTVIDLDDIEVREAVDRESGVRCIDGQDRATAENHLRLLEDLFLVVRLPAWGKTLRSRVSVKPKVHVVDSGVAARLLRLTPDKLRGVDPAALTDFGHLLETFVVGEVRKQASWLGEPVALGHWRTSDGDEVDLVIERDDGRVLALEVKASERAPGPEFRGMAKLRDLLGERFLGGIMMTTGKRSYTYQDRLHVLPVDRLWTTVGGYTSGVRARG